MTRLHLAAIVGLALAHFVTQWLHQVRGFGSVYGLVDFFDLANEGNLPAFFSTWQLLLCAGVLAIIAAVRQAGHDPFRWQWTTLAILTCYLAVDEAAGIHELLIRPMQQLLPGLTTGLLYWAWVIPGALGVLIAAIAYSRFAFRALPRDLFLQLVLAGVIFVGGAIGVEMFEAAFFQLHGQHNMTYATFVLFEETMEMVGELIALNALLQYWRREVGAIALVTRD